MTYHKPIAFRGLNKAFQLGQLLGGVPRHLDPDKLERKARKRTRLKNYGDDYYRPGLEMLCESLNSDSTLNAYGCFLGESTITSFLETRLLLQKRRDQNDPVLQTELIDPIIVSGLPRTGTTALHRMLAAAPGHKGLEWWELNLPMNRNASDSAEDRIKTAEAIIRPRELFTPHLDAIHYIRPHTLEECLWLMGCTFNGRTVSEYMVAYKYIDWYYSKADADKKYRDYADLLRILQAAHPGERLVLKSIEHLENPHLILKHVPNAMLVQTHRKPVESVPSYCSLNSVAADLSCHDLDKHRQGAELLNLLDRSMQAHLKNREGLDDKIYDHFYTDMLADPISCVRRVYEKFGLEWSDNVAYEVGLHTRENQQHKYGHHKYHISDFGLSDEIVNERFADYIERFLPERAR